MKRGLFVSLRGHLEGHPPGGVQICSHEYISVIEAAGFQLKLCLLDLDRRISTRLMRRLGLSHYRRPAERGALGRIASTLRAYEPDFIFLNQVALTALAPGIRRQMRQDAKVVALSHGLESTDLLHHLRLHRRLPLTGRVRRGPAAMLGEAILSECALRSHLDFVCALSPFDVELEHWIGARRVDWLPRMVVSAPLDWRPDGARLGFVGTLDHAPNLEGLVEVLPLLASADRRGVVRIVSSSAAAGRWLAERHPGVEYLGALGDDDLRSEAATWNAFIHPIFCYPRGCSTKLATAIGWHLPIVTTTMGYRGYELGSGRLVVADDPSAFAAECLRLLDNAAAAEARREVAKVAQSAPSLHDNARRLQALLSQ